MTRTKNSSLTNALRILKSFSVDDIELTLDDIAEQIAISKSTACRLVQTLESEGFITQNTRYNTYALGSSILSLSNTLLEQFYSLKDMTSFLKNLTKVTGESSHIAVLQGNEVIYLKKEDNEHRVQLRSHIGRRNPAHCTASGLALLGYLSDEEIEMLYKDGFHQETAYSISSITQLNKRLEEGRKQGYFISDKEMVENVLSIGAPLFNKDGEVFASISVAGLRQRMRPQMKKIIDQVIKTSIEISDFIKQS
ncbi:IclR family transcriptional regulator [Ureibacillus endophyticus]|uniref:IclR family transcriptional regulator n=1 Tax=Ureibacillus endophyticus TaxID=1978490 RepID=A0A494YS17_9BACL|nr:IclR family transcriptional regulator [Lysinibacillus endophyticus]RKQ12469.1 IclR family transcriptional regulator [Lysinibacillus endophyticus]